MYNLLAENYKDQHAKLVSIILKATSADKIYLLGSTLIKRRTESIFMTAAPCHSYVSHCYLLVVVSNDADLNAVEDKIENNCRHFIPVTAIVLHTHQFNEWLTTGHQFACTVYKTAMLLHGETDKKFASSEILGEEFIKTDKESIYSQGLNKVTEYLAGADLYRIRKQNNMAAFMLHQAAEHALYTMLKITTGLHINTHNLDKLIRYCSMVSPTLPDIFPGNNEKNERLFQLLQKANTGIHYKENYSICTKDLITITDRVRVLQQMMQEMYNSGL